MNKLVTQLLTRPLNSVTQYCYNYQQSRGIRVMVFDENMEQALKIMQRQMTSSGIERMIKRPQRFHIKNSEKKTTILTLKREIPKALGDLPIASDLPIPTE
ncbi:hypothetical protein ACFE04_031037 [Oxalis oulophora]